MVAVFTLRLKPCLVINSAALLQKGLCKTWAMYI